MKFYLDTEFNEHGGKLISLALVPESPRVPFYIVSDDFMLITPWVRDNVCKSSILHAGPVAAFTVEHANHFGTHIRSYIGEDENPCIIADSPVDIWRFCQALSTDEWGQWQSADYSRMTLEVHNVDCYPTDLPGAIQHNALWDALVLKHKLESA